MLEKLKAQKRWFCWKLETRQGQDKPTKVPYSAISGRKTGTDAKFSDTWTDYETAQKSCAEYGYSGVGFRIPEDMFFLDIDHTTTDDPRVKRIKDLLKTYAELSQSGAGPEGGPPGPEGKSGWPHHNMPLWRCRLYQAKILKLCIVIK